MLKKYLLHVGLISFLYLSTVKIYAQNPIFNENFDKMQQAEKQRDYVKAIEYAEKIIPFVLDEIGDDTENYGKFYHNLARYLYFTNNFLRADTTFRKAQKAYEKVPGKESLAFATNLHWWAKVDLSQQKYAEAERKMTEARLLRKKLLDKAEAENKQDEYSKAFRDYAQSLNDWGELLVITKREKGVDTLFKQAVEMRRQLGAKSTDYSRSLGNLASIYYNQGKYTEALPLFEEAIQISQQNQRNNTLEYAHWLSVTGNLYQLNRNFAKAEKYYNEALELRKNLTADNSLETASSLADLGDLYEEMQQYDKAEPLLQNALNLYKANPTAIQSQEYGQVTTTLAKIYFGKGEYSKAETLFNEVLAIRQKSGDKSSYANILNNLADTYASNKDFAKAEPKYLEALKITKELDAKGKEYAKTLNNLAELYINQNRWKDAESLLQQAVEIRKEILGEEHPDFLRSLSNLAITYRNRRNLSEAERLLRQITTLLAKNPARRLDYADYLNMLAGVLYQSAKIYEAKKMYQQALEIYKANQTNENPIYVNSLKNLATIYQNEGLYTEAEDLYKQALQSIKENKNENSSLYVNVLGSLGYLYTTLSRFDEAEAIYKEALSLIQKNKLEKEKVYPEILNELGVLYKKAGRYPDAERHYLQAMKIYESSKNTDKNPTYATIVNNLATLYVSMGQYPDAEKLFKQALDIRKNTVGIKHPSYATALDNLAALYRKMNKPIEIEKQLKEALAIRKEAFGENDPDYASSLDNLAGFYRSVKRFTEAEPLLKQAIEIRKKVFGQKHPAYAASLNNLGSLYVDMNQLTQAEPIFKEALQIFKTTLGENHPDFASSLNNMALLYENMKKYEDAKNYYKDLIKNIMNQIQNTFPALSEKEKIKFFNKNKNFLDNFIIFAINSISRTQKEGLPKEFLSILGDAYDLEISTKAIVLSATSKVRKRILASGNEALISKYKTWQAQRELIAKLYSQSEAELKAKGVNLDSLTNLVNNLEKEISLQSEDFNAAYNPKIPSWKDIQAKLKDNEAAITMIRLNPIKDSVQYAAFIITPQTLNYPEVVILNNGGQLEKRYLSNYKKTIRFQTNDKYSYNMFWQPIKEKIPNVKKIYFAPDGVYNQINLSTLRNPETQSYLLDELEVTTVTNIKDILEERKTTEKNNRTAFLVGNPTYLINKSLTAAKNTINMDNQRSAWLTLEPFAQLQGTEIEVQRIKELLKLNGYMVEIRTREQATEEAVKNVQSPTILHIATHGFFIPQENKDEANKGAGLEEEEEAIDPMLRSGLVLAGVNDYALLEKKPEGEDGVLTAYEIANLSLERTEVVSASACETGLGEVQNGEGVYGIQRALKIAGAQNIIMSLWKVDDAATQQLMNSFYEEEVKTGNRKLAFLNAQRKIREQFPNPYYWGAFVMIGE